MRPARASNVVAANSLAIEKVARTKVEKQSEWKVDGVRGLSVVVKPSGTATYYVRYQIGSGRQRTERRVAIGKAGHGGLSFADARGKAAELTSKAEAGVDHVKVEEANARRLTLEGLFAERRVKDAGTASRTLTDYGQALKRDVFPELGSRLADDITSDEFAKLLERIEDRAPHVAHKVRSALGSTYRWAQRRRMVKVNPVAVLAFTHQSAPRKRVLNERELRQLWAAIEGTKHVSQPLQQIIQLAILTGQRNSEVAGMSVEELKALETATPRWDIPAQRMKRKTEDQFVPLSTQAAVIVREAIGQMTSGPVFPADPRGRDSNRRSESIGQESVSRAFARVAANAGLADLRLHDMRKCITTWLAEHGHATPEVLDAILHHGRKGVTGSHYNFALYEGQVRKALQAWADHVTSFASDQSKNSNVVTLVQA